MCIGKKEQVCSGADEAEVVSLLRFLSVFFAPKDTTAHSCRGKGEIDVVLSLYLGHFLCYSSVIISSPTLFS